MILVIIEHAGGVPERASGRAVAFAQRLAQRSGTHAGAIAFGPRAEEALGALRSAGLTRSWFVRQAAVDAYAPAAWARSVGQLAAAFGADVIVAPGTRRGNELMAHVAAQLGMPMAANCLEVISNHPFVVMRQRWGGSVLEEARLDATVRCMTVAESAPEPEEGTAAAGSEPIPVEAYVPTLSAGDLRVRRARHERRESAGVPLAGARVVVGGGRGVGSAGGFAALDELASLLGGAVGVSRVVTTAGWRPHTDQIGQTGTRISPEVYLACGISGAIQHVVGCSSARTIIAINTDPDAPLLSRASYAVIGDLHTVVPAISAEIRRVRGDG